MEIRGCVPELSYTTSNSAYGTDWEKGEYMSKSFSQSTPYKGLTTAAVKLSLQLQAQLYFTRGYDVVGPFFESASAVSLHFAKSPARVVLSYIASFYTYDRHIGHLNILSIENVSKDFLMV